MSENNNNTNNTNLDNNSCVIKGKILTTDSTVTHTNTYLDNIIQFSNLLVSPFYNTQNNLNDTINSVIKLNFAIPTPNDCFWINYNTSYSRYTPVANNSLYDAGFFTNAENNVLSTVNISLRSNIDLSNTRVDIYKVANGISIDDQSNVGFPIGTSDGNNIYANKVFSILFTPLIINKYDILLIKLTNFNSTNLMGNVTIY